MKTSNDLGPVWAWVVGIVVTVTAAIYFVGTLPQSSPIQGAVMDGVYYGDICTEVEK